ncbi:TPA: hypothetical protein JZG05_000069 [Escherichia coli]|nr:hypothetical protein [Escherichia coli]HAX4925659.1 hypothetical protein [Escherichia coli]
MISIIASSAPGLSPLARGTRSSTVSSGASSPVYPRWSGEHFFCRIQPYFFAGLSPLARGTRSGEAGKRG